MSNQSLAKRIAVSLRKSARIPSWMSGSIKNYYSILLADEGDFVKPISGSYARLLSATLFGLADYEEEPGAMEISQLLENPTEAAKKINEYLDTSYTHGEYIGQIVGTWDKIPKSVQSLILPHLERAIELAMQKGVDH